MRKIGPNEEGSVHKARDGTAIPDPLQVERTTASDTQVPQVAMSEKRRVLWYASDE